jgi:anthranilate synthase/aminodeoxychorismate synthase-like glutamine amidotransferase
MGMIALIDNYDSFSYNLVQSLMGQGAEVEVYRNDMISVEDVLARKPAGIMISPGPCTPKQAGISVELARAVSGMLPLLGVCLGHQSIAAAFGATISNSARIMHGKVSMMKYEDSPLYAGLQNPFAAGRYHSLSIVEDTLPDCFTVDAHSDDGEIMGMHHREHETFGVQFHPESVLTPEGDQLLGNFLKIVNRE